MMVEVNALGSFIQLLLEQYGLTGAAFAAVLWLLWRANKKAEAAKIDADARITELEKKQDELYEAQAKKQDEVYQAQAENYKSMINQYVDLVKSKIEVLSKLTTVIDTMNATLNKFEGNKPKE